MKEKVLVDIEGRKLEVNDIVLYANHTGTLRAADIGIIVEPNKILSKYGVVHNLSSCYKIDKYNSPILNKLHTQLLDIKPKYLFERKAFEKYGLVQGGVYRYQKQEVNGAVVYLGQCQLIKKYNPNSIKSRLNNVEIYTGPILLDINMINIYQSESKDYNYFVSYLKSNIQKLYTESLEDLLIYHASVYHDFSNIKESMNYKIALIDRFVCNINNFKCDKLSLDVFNYPYLDRIEIIIL